MKLTVSRVVTISDLVQWYDRDELELSPKYQRNSVWNEKAKAYLIDTIVRGLAIPPVFIRQTIDVNTRTTHREVIDGQQRIRAILEYVVDESFTIKKSHNKEYGGKKYSELTEDVQTDILGYEVLVENVTGSEDSIIYDMFARLNSNNVVLNKQEMRNAKYWGEFKVLAYQLASEYRDFFLRHGILSDKDCSRMKDVELINSMLIIMLEGFLEEANAAVDRVYQSYDSSFDEADAIATKVHEVMRVVEKVYEYFNGNYGCFSNKTYFFTMYAVILNLMYSIKGYSELKRSKCFEAKNIESNIQTLCRLFGNFITGYQAYVDDGVDDDTQKIYQEFIKYHERRTTGKNERIKRIEILNNLILLDEKR